MDGRSLLLSVFSHFRSVSLSIFSPICHLLFFRASVVYIWYQHQKDLGLDIPRGQNKGLRQKFKFYICFIGPSSSIHICNYGNKYKKNQHKLDGLSLIYHTQLLQCNGFTQTFQNSPIMIFDTKVRLVSSIQRRYLTLKRDWY